MMCYWIKILPILVVSVAHAQNGYNSKTLFHQGGALVEKAIVVDFLTEEGTISNKWIRSLKTFSLDSIIFLDDNPDRMKVFGTEILLNFRTQDKNLLVDEFSPEYYATFTAYHATRMINFYEQIFGGKIDFNAQVHYADIEVFIGNSDFTNPKQFCFLPRSKPSPTLIYHEIGHRAFWYIEQELGINLGSPGSFIHMGLLEYFTASVADHPIILEGAAPKDFWRDVSTKVKYPDDMAYFPQFLETFRIAYESTFDTVPWHKRYYDLRYKQMTSWDSIYQQAGLHKTVEEGHRSALLIAHPLWNIRSRIGATKTDTLVATAILSLPDLMKERTLYLAKSITPVYPAFWYDIIYALVQADKRLYDGTNTAIIKQQFENCGYEIKLINGI